MKTLKITKLCTIRHISENMSFEELVTIEIGKESSFSIGAEGFFVSVVNLLAQKKLIESVKIYLTNKEILDFGINEKSILSSPGFLNVCILGVKIIDRFGKSVDDVLPDALAKAINIEEGIFKGTNSVCLFAYDPFYKNPPIMNLEERDPSEDDFSKLLKGHIQESLVGEAIESAFSLENIYESIDLYSFIKEIWENTTHHARRSERSLRYIKISRLIFKNQESISELGFTSGTKSFFLNRYEKDKIRKFLILEIVDSGYGIYQSLKKSFPDQSVESVLLKAFDEEVSSKKQRSSINRGLGLSTANKCATKLESLFIMTSSGYLYTNYFHNKDLFNNDVVLTELKNIPVNLSTSVSLVIPIK